MLKEGALDEIEDIMFGDGSSKDSLNFLEWLGRADAHSGAELGLDYIDTYGPWYNDEVGVRTPENSTGYLGCLGTIWFPFKQENAAKRLFHNEKEVQDAIINAVTPYVVETPEQIRGKVRYHHDVCAKQHS